MTAARGHNDNRAIIIMMITIKKEGKEERAKQLT